MARFTDAGVARPYAGPIGVDEGTCGEGGTMDTYAMEAEAAFRQAA